MNAHLRPYSLAAVAALALLATSARAANCDAMDLCAAKACRLDLQIAQAKAANNARQLAGLERAKAESGHCSDDGLKAKRQMALEQAQKKIDVRQAELAKAQAGGSAKKIAKAQKKLDNARSVRTELEASPL